MVCICRGFALHTHLRIGLVHALKNKTTPKGRGRITKRIFSISVIPNIDIEICQIQAVISTSATTPAIIQFLCLRYKTDIVMIVDHHRRTHLSLKLKSTSRLKSNGSWSPMNISINKIKLLLAHQIKKAVANSSALDLIEADWFIIVSLSMLYLRSLLPPPKA